MSSARSTTLPAATRPGAGSGGGSGSNGGSRAGSLPGSVTRAQSAKGALRGTGAARTAGPGATTGAGGAAALRSASAGRRAGAAGVFDTPRGFGEDGLSEEQELAIELDSVKRERERLLEAIAHVKGSAGAGYVRVYAPCVLPRCACSCVVGVRGGRFVCVCRAGMRCCRPCSCCACALPYGWLLTFLGTHA
mgnify:CR=1 FL=1